MSFLTLRLRWKVKLISRSWISHRNVWTFRFSPRVTSFGSCEFLINHYHVEKPFMNPFMRRPNTFWFTSVDVLYIKLSQRYFDDILFVHVHYSAFVFFCRRGIPFKCLSIIGFDSQWNNLNTSWHFWWKSCWIIEWHFFIFRNTLSYEEDAIITSDLGFNMFWLLHRFFQNIWLFFLLCFFFSRFTAYLLSPVSDSRTLLCD